MWSDPEEIEGGTWSVSPRGAGWLFGAKVTQEVRFHFPSSPPTPPLLLSPSLARLTLAIPHQFNHINSLSLIARAHQLVQEGYKFMFPPERNLVTVWSAPNYCYRCGNVASVMQVREGGRVGEEDFRIFDAGALRLVFLFLADGKV